MALKTKTTKGAATRSTSRPSRKRKSSGSSGAGVVPETLAAPAQILPQNRSFEEAVPSYNRPTVYLTSLEAKKELPPWDRIRLMNHARWLVNNSPIAARIVRGISRYAVGNGLTPQARTANNDWNSRAEQLFEDRVATDAFAFDKAGAVNFYDSQRLIVEQMVADGEFFAQLCTSENGGGMCRFFGAEYVGSRMGDEVDGWRDGVMVNEDNRAIFYRVLSNPMLRDGTYTDIPADELIHIRKLHRHGFQRGLTWLCSSVSLIQDLREMLENEQAAARLNSKIGLVIESPDAGNLGMGASMRKLRAQDVENSLGTPIDGTAGSGSSGSGTLPDEQITFDRLVSGVGNVQLKPGEKLTAHEFDRPNTNFAPWTEFVVRSISWSCGMPPELLWNMTGVGGAVTRHVLQDAEVFFSEIRQILEYQYCRRFWRYWVWHAMKRGDLDYPGDDWWRCDWIAPQKLTVDTGRDGALRLNLVRSGLLSSKRYFAELGQDVDSETDDIIRDYARKKRRVTEIAQETGVELSMSEVFPPAPGSAPIVPAARAAVGILPDPEPDPGVGDPRSLYPRLFA